MAATRTKSSCTVAASKAITSVPPMERMMALMELVTLRMAVARFGFGMK